MHCILYYSARIATTLYSFSDENFGGQNTMIPSRPGDGRGKRATVPSVRERAGPQQHLSSGCLAGGILLRMHSTYAPEHTS